MRWASDKGVPAASGSPHLAGGERGEIPEVGFDYFYLGRTGTGLPNIAAKDRDTGTFAGTTLEAKFVLKGLRRRKGTSRHSILLPLSQRR